MEETKYIKFTKGYKYQLEEDAWFYTGIMLQNDFVAKWAIHHKNGWMQILDGFGWDGCSSITLDDDKNNRACLFHDGMAYLMRHGLGLEYLDICNEGLERIMLEDGAGIVRARLYKLCVEMAGKSFANPKNRKKVYISPPYSDKRR